MADIEQRLTSLEERLARIEEQLARKPTPEIQTNPYERAPSPMRQSVPASSREPRVETPKQIPRQTDSEHMLWSATNILGWGGATALVLAAAYLILLAIDNGWLTPVRQVACSVLGALILIGTGFRLRESDRMYASFLPAGGIVILFFSIYGAHLDYHLISTTTAGGAIIVVCIVSLWLCRVFESQLYALFAVIGSYSAPFLLPSLRNEITDVVIYYSAWSILFCIYSIWVGSRRVYILALYMGLIGFDLIWRTTASSEWTVAVIFQLIQFIIFAVCATYYSIRHDDPMKINTAVAHAPALLIFYMLEYSLLDKHSPDYAPWLAAASVAFLGMAYAAARLFLKESSKGGRWLLSAYASLVLLHAGYIESVSSQWEPWVALVIVLVAALYGFLRRNTGSIGWPMILVIGIIYVVNYFRVILDINLKEVPAHDLLVILYAVELYVGYYFVRSIKSLKGFGSLLLYCGHISLMAAAVHLFDERILVSLSWGLLALACIVLAISQKNKTLGQSSLLVFAASAGKALLYDLSGAAPLVRISCLLVLGITFYVGGWLYRMVNDLETVPE